MNPFEKILYKISDFQVRNPYSTLLILLAITLFFIGGLSSVKTVASLETMMPLDTPEVEYFNLLRDEFGGKDSLAVVLTIRDDLEVDGFIDISEYEIMKYVYSLEQEIQKNSKITSTSSLASYLEFTMLKEFGQKRFPNEQEYNYIMNLEEFSQVEDVFINFDKTTTMIVATTDVGTLDAQMSSLSDKLQLQIQQLGYPAGVEVKLTGSPILQQTLGQLINTDKVVTFTAAALFIFIALLGVFRSLLLALAPLLMVMLAAIWLYGTMGYVEIPISTLAGGVASMVMGIGIAYSIHILNRFKVERKQKHSIEKAMDLAVVKTGFAVVATSATTLVAFFAFYFGQMPEMGRFGLLMVIGIFYTMVLSLFGLGAFLVLEEKLQAYLTKKRRELLEE